MQIAITQQGIMALQLTADGQAALGDAIDRARNTSVAALRTAIAARRAVVSNRDLLEQAEALENTASAAQTAPQSDRAVAAALTDALEQARRAINATQALPRTH
jgi:Mg2+ and Co2+ transporter CorA